LATPCHAEAAGRRVQRAMHIARPWHVPRWMPASGGENGVSSLTRAPMLLGRSARRPRLEVHGGRRLLRILRPQVRGPRRVRRGERGAQRHRRRPGRSLRALRFLRAAGRAVSRRRHVGSLCGGRSPAAFCTQSRPPRGSVACLLLLTAQRLPCISCCIGCCTVRGAHADLSVPLLRAPAGLTAMVCSHEVRQQHTYVCSVTV